MSINKFALSVALAGILGASSALAENEGSFVGGQLASSWVDTKYTTIASNAYTSTSFSGSGVGKSGSRFGAVYGKYYTIDEDMGYRAYGLADLGDSLYNVNVNMDFLYTFVKFEKVEVRGFVSAYMGGVFITDMEIPYYRNTVSDDKEMTMGIDAGLNASLRVVVVDRHGIDVFYRYGLLEVQTENTYNYNNW